MPMLIHVLLFTFNIMRMRSDKCDVPVVSPRWRLNKDLLKQRLVTLDYIACISTLNTMQQL